jgi:acyl-homoserine-lactone acylase
MFVSGLTLIGLLASNPASAAWDWSWMWTGVKSHQKIKYDVKIQRTSYGIPHIRAKDWGSLGYGYGYTFSQDNFCVLMRDVVVANGQQARFFGPVGNNVPNDWVYAMINSDAKAQAGWERLDEKSQDLVRGYAAGVSRYLSDTGANGVAEDCRGQAFVRPIDHLDIMKVLAKLTMRAGTANFLLSIAGAAPPAPSVAVLSPQGAAEAVAAVANSRPDTQLTPEEAAALLAQAELPDFSVERFGSNAVALGSELTHGAGALLGNPHFPWFGIERFYAVHLTIPGKYDVMGNSIFGFPIVNIGFNKDVAWSHTVSTGRRFVVRELKLAPGDPTSYLYNGSTVPMTTETVTIEILLPDGSIVPSSHTFYLTQFGPMMIIPPLAGWSATTGYALTDVNTENSRGFKMYREMGQARSTYELEQAMTSNLASPWVNTIAADRQGDAYYGDVTTVPHVTDEKLAICANTVVAQILSGSRVYTLDGSTSACDLGHDPDAAAPGLFGPSNLPRLHRDDYVQNSNDSYWLSNPEERLEGFPQIMGTDEGEAQAFRTRLGITQIRDRQAGLDDQPGTGFNRQWLQDVLYANRHYSGEIMLDGVLTLCNEEDVNVDVGGGVIVDVSEACSVLAGWDGRNNTDSVGTHVWQELWGRMRGIAGLYAVPFDDADPVNTPRDVDLANEAVRASVMAALGQTVQRYAGLSIPLDVAWGTVQFDTRGDGEIIPIHGGSGGSGVYNAISPGSPVAGVGFTPIFGGSSYIQAVSFGRRGPDARAIVTYSQSTDVNSAHFSDMTRLFSDYGWVSMPFRQPEIRKDPNFTEFRLKGFE